MSQCPEFCSTPDMNDCSERHLASFCPPVCTKCSPCMITFQPTCEMSQSDACQERYEILKHVVKCPSEGAQSICCNIPPRRSSFRPIVHCQCPSTNVESTPCYETNYMKSFNTPSACCKPCFCQNQ